MSESANLNRIVPCMGGFCASRDGCAHYFAKRKGVKPCERLCGRIEEPVPVKPPVKEAEAA